MKYLEMKLIVGVISVILREMQPSEGKHWIFHKNKDSRSKDQNQNESISFHPY